MGEKQISSNQTGLREKGREDLLQLFKALLDRCCDILDVVIYSINNRALFVNIINSVTNSISIMKIMTCYQKGCGDSQTWSITRTERSFMICARSLTDSTTYQEREREICQ